MRIDRGFADRGDTRALDADELISDEALDQVVGGINPQPLPPSHEIGRGPSCPGYQ
jgi:hypothetical protein